MSSGKAACGINTNVSRVSRVSHGGVPSRGYSNSPTGRHVQSSLPMTPQGSPWVCVGGVPHQPSDGPLRRKALPSHDHHTLAPFILYCLLEPTAGPSARSSLTRVYFAPSGSTAIKRGAVRDRVRELKGEAGPWALQGLPAPRPADYAHHRAASAQNAKPHRAG